MRIRDVVLQYRHGLLDNGVWTFPINLVDPITELKFWFRVDNNAVGPNEAGCVPYLINELAVIDGSEVIASLNGPEAVAVAAFDHGRLPYHRHQEQGGMGQNWCVSLHFGRDVVDQEYILDPTRFRNPQIRVDWNLANVAAVGAGGYATNSANLSVWAKVMEEGATPIGYLMTKELKEFVTVGAGQDITYLPTDFDIRKLFVRTYLKGGAMETALTNFKLSQDEDKWIPVDLDTNDLKALMLDWFTEVEFNLRNQADDNEQREHYQDAGARGMAVGGEDDDIVGISGFANNIYTLHAVTDAGAGDTDVRHWVSSRGVYPMSTFCYPFGQQDDPNDWLEVARIGNLRLILTQGAAGYTTQIVVQQAHPY